MTNTLKLFTVEYMPRHLEPGILYFSEEFDIAAHMCPCGCGNKVFTPIGPTNWSLTIRKGKPTLNPSIGNWQIPCKSHYWVKDGSIEWSYTWTDREILAGRKKEEEKRKTYYDNLKVKKKKQPIFYKIRKWILSKIKVQNKEW